MTRESRISQQTDAFKTAAAGLWYSFPVQLFIVQLRQNHLLLGIWILLVLLIKDVVAAKFGVKYLFLEPEYLGKVGPQSFFHVGVGMGGLIMTWNLTTYLLNARYFPFLATLQRPFGKYCVNNALLPLAFVSFYISELYRFTRSELGYHQSELWLAVASMLLGMLTVILAYVLYFRFTNKDIASIPDLRGLLSGRSSRRTLVMPPGYRGVDIGRIISGESAWRVDTYLTERFVPRRTRPIHHYQPDQLLRVFRQNHLNALVLQAALLVMLMASGLGIDYQWIRIPAGASIFILLSTIAAIAGAITYWFHTWRTSIFIILLVLINVVTSRDWFTFRNQAYGLDYREPLPKYNYSKLVELGQPAAVAADRDSMLQVLNRWKARTGEEKPRMVLLCVSGGGLKATYWTTHVLQHLDQSSGGELFKHTTMISGASGGMIGAAYYRELKLRAEQYQYDQVAEGQLVALHPSLQSLGVKTSKWKHPQEQGGFGESPQPERQAGESPGETAIPIDPNDPYHLAAAGKDLLNSVSFAIVTNDLFLPSGRFSFDGVKHRKDRAYAFERQLNENLGGVFDKRLGDYEKPEREGRIPMLMLTPSVVNDARRLIISPLGVQHLTMPPAAVGRTREFEIDAIDFQAFFADQKPERLAFSTGLRMNATYPYVLPNVYLPSEPPVEVMDAGFRDNFGVSEAGRFLQVYRDWILENTSGVLMIQISTLKKFDDQKQRDPQGWIESLLNPLGVAAQLISLQDYQIDESVGLLSDLFGEENFEFLRLSYQPAEDRQAASMTFHLTEREKADIRASIAQPNNQLALEKIYQAIGVGSVSD